MSWGCSTSTTQIQHVDSELVELQEMIEKAVEDCKLAGVDSVDDLDDILSLWSNYVLFNMVEIRTDAPQPIIRSYSNLACYMLALDKQYHVASNQRQREKVASRAKRLLTGVIRMYPLALESEHLEQYGLIFVCSHAISIIPGTVGMAVNAKLKDESLSDDDKLPLYAVLTVVNGAPIDEQHVVDNKNQIDRYVSTLKHRSKWGATQAISTNSTHLLPNPLNDESDQTD